MRSSNKSQENNTLMMHSWVLLVVMAVVLVVTACANNAAPTNVAPSNAGSVGAGSSISGQTATKLSDTPVWKYAYLVSGDTLDPAAQTALAGFNLQKTPLSDGSVQFTFTTTRQSYFNQTYIVAPGQQLYFIESSMGDDGPDVDTSLRDDSAVVVDSQGYIVPRTQ